MSKRLDAMIQSFTDERLRWLIGKGKSLVDKGKMTREEYEAVAKEIMQTEMQRKMIVSELGSGPLTVSEIASRVKLPPKLVLKHLISLRRESIVAIKGERDDELEFHRLEKPLDAVSLLSLPDYLRKTALAMIKLIRATANSVANETGGETIMESRYLRRLVEMGYLKRETQDNEIYFYL